MKRFFSRTSHMYLAASAVTAVLAAAALLAYLQGVRARVAQCGRLVPLVVASRNLEAGEVLDPSDLKVIDFPDRYLLPGSSTDPLLLAGSTLRHPLAEGEPLLESDLLPAGGGGLAQESLEQGFRAYPLPASSVSFPLGELAAGSRVDVLAVGEQAAVPLLENVEVLGVSGGPSSPQAAEAGYEVGGDPWSACILLQLTSEEACRLAAAQEGGKVEVLLRPRDLR